MKYSSFILKTVSLALIVGVLFHYQGVAEIRAAEVAENEAAIAEVEAYNKAILAAQREAEDTYFYVNGTYEGEGNGFGGPVSIAMEIVDDEITAINVVNAAGEDAAYFVLAETLLDEIIKKQSTDVDTVSGATFSSNGLIEAVEDALGKAEA